MANPDRPLWLPAAMLAAFITGAGIAALALPPDVEAAIPGPPGPDGKIVKIVDGDTFEFKTTGGETLTIRLAQIDAPELAQPWGPQAKAAFAKLVESGEVKLRSGGIDAQGKSLAVVRAGEINVNFEMVRQGLAWTNPHYVVDPRLVVLEQAARNGKAGLWSAPPGQIVEPEVWRARHPVVVKKNEPVPPIRSSRRTPGSRTPTQVGDQLEQEEAPASAGELSPGVRRDERVEG